MVDRMGDLKRKTKDKHRAPHKHAYKLAKKEVRRAQGEGSAVTSSSYGSLAGSSSSDTETTATADAAGAGGEEV